MQNLSRICEQLLTSAGVNRNRQKSTEIYSCTPLVSTSAFFTISITVNYGVTVGPQVMSVKQRAHALAISLGVTCAVEQTNSTSPRPQHDNKEIQQVDEKNMHQIAFIGVIDMSGSMSGARAENVRFFLNDKDIGGIFGNGGVAGIFALTKEFHPVMEICNSTSSMYSTAVAVLEPHLHARVWQRMHCTAPAIFIHIFTHIMKSVRGCAVA